MKRSHLKTTIMEAGTVVVLLLIGTVATMYAQHEQNGRQDAKQQNQPQPAKSKKQQKQSKPVMQQKRTIPATRQQRAAPVKQQQRATPAARQQQATPVKRQQANRPSRQGQRVQQAEQKGMWQQHRAGSWQAEHRTWKQRGGYNGYRIPQSHFSGYFGRAHGFRVYSRTLVIYEGYPSFEYNGYWFSIIDPWPEYWSDDWYQNDDVYIDYSGDGYYLYDLGHPGIGIAINVYMN